MRMTKKRGLGKGLSALIPDDDIIDKNDVFVNSDNVIEIDTYMIEPNTEQPRTNFDDDSLNELKESIKKYGIIQPIIVRKHGKGYQIVAGERRWRASKEIGLKKIPCLIRDYKKNAAIEVALIENIQREDLNPIEEAFAYKNMMDKYNITQEKIAEVIGKSRTYIANTIRLLKLNEKIIDYIKEGIISPGHGRALLSIKDKNIQLDVAERIIKRGLNVRQTEKIVKDILSKKKKTTKSKIKQTKDAALLEIEEILSKSLGTKVQVTKRKNKGIIEIEYYSNDDLQKIIEILNKK